MFGALFNGIVGYVAVCFICLLITLIFPFSVEFNQWFNNTIMVDDPQTFTLAKYIYQNNILVHLIELVSNSN